MFCAASTLALALAAAPAEADEAEAAADVEELVVTGSVIQGRAAIRARQEAVAVVDTLSRDDIGALPDMTIAESMRRIVGVTTVYNDDIGQFASIRGLHPDFIPVTLNGLTLATTGDLGEGTRKVNLQVIPGEAVSQIQAFKTLSPDIDAGALGGLINLVPVSAFGDAGPSLIASGGGSYTTYMDVPDINSAGDRKDSAYGGLANIIASTRFGPDDAFGVTVSGSWQRRPRTQTNFATVGRLYFNAAGAATTPESADWTGAAAPSQFTVHNYTNVFDKFGGTARLEYKPSDRLYASLFGFAYYSDEQETRNTNRLFSFDQPQNLTATTGSLRVRSADSQWRYNTFERDQRGLQGQAIASIGERGELSANVGYSYARFLSERPFVSFLYKPNTRLTYDLGNEDRPFVLTNAPAYLNPSNYQLADTYRDWRHARAHVWDSRVDYGFNNKPDDRGLGFAVGAAYRTLDLKRDITSINYTAGGLALSGLALDPASFIPPGYFAQALWIDQEAFWDRARSLPVNAAASAQASGVSDYRYEEQIAAAYAALNYTADRFNVIGGLRLDQVSFDATMAQVVGGVLQPQPVTRSSDDTHVLPYLTGVVNLTDSLRLKFGASQTLGRPNPETIATVETVDPSEQTITRGNPDIKPRQATNFDIGLEQYFNGGQGMVTLTAFYKDIKDDILTVTSLQPIGGLEWEVSQPINGEKTTYKGLEFGLINNSFGDLHPMLERVGASLNVMWIKGETHYAYNGQRRVREDLLYQADYAGNAAVFYSFGEGSEVRLAYNRQGRYVEEYGAMPWTDVVSPPFGTVDLTVKWAFHPNWQLGVEGRNILDEDRLRNTGPDHEFQRARLEIGGSWFMRLTYRR